MYRVALHIGIPKTATTSLQDNLLYPAHLEGEINYLGRYGDPMSASYFNPFEVVFTDLTRDYLSSKDILRLQSTLFNLMEKDKLNVISEEILSSTHRFGYRRIENLKKILSPCNVKILVSLREPMSFFHSYYAECFRGKFHAEKKINTIDKFVNKILSDRENKEYDVFYFDRFLFHISSLFPNIDVLLFEDIKYDKGFYFKKISSFFELKESYVKASFLREEKNTRVVSVTGKVSEGVTLNQKIHEIMQIILGRSIKKVLKKIAIMRYLYKYILKLSQKITVNKGRVHVISDNTKMEELRQSLLANCSLMEKYKVDVSKLKLYGYCSDK